MAPSHDEPRASREPIAAAGHSTTSAERSAEGEVRLEVGLREWAVVVDALQRGSVTTLVRKGGIHEMDGVARFAPEHSAFAFVPTWLHQRPERARWTASGGALDAAQAPSPAADGSLTVPITSWAQAVAAWWVRDRSSLAAIEALTPFPIDELESRFVYRRDGLWILLVRVWCLASAVETRLRADQLACASWIELERPITADLHAPACSTELFSDVSRALHAHLGTPTVASSSMGSGSLVPEMRPRCSSEEDSSATGGRSDRLGR